MRYLLCLICFFSLSINAQDTNDTVTVLSKAEVQKAKALYTEMMQTPTYILLKSKQKAVFKGLNGLDYPSVAPKDLKRKENLKAALNDWLPKNLSKTKFSSVKEGVDLIMETIELGEKC